MVSRSGLAWVLMVVATGVCAPTAAAPTVWQSYQGEARDPDSNALLYLERHYQRFDADRLSERVVAYVCPDGERMFARKRVDYTRSLTAPAFELRDARSDYREGMRWRGDDRVALFAGALHAEPDLTVAPAPANLVADAGFDEFVRESWPDLIAGQSVSLRFGVPARASSYRFTLVPDGEANWNGRPALALALRLSGVLGWFAPEIRVLYDLEHRRLLHYEGLSNLRDAGGSQLSARIAFPNPSVAVTPDTVDAALAAPLGTCSPAPRLSTAERETDATSGSGHSNTAP